MNTFFTTPSLQQHPLTSFRGSSTLSIIRTYGDLLTAETTITNLKQLAAIRRKKESIHHIRQNVSSNLIKGLYDRKE